MQDARRVERLWVAMAVAMVWLHSLGTQAESQLLPPRPEDLPERHIGRLRRKSVPQAAPARRLSCVQRGRLVLLAPLVQAQDLPIGRLEPENWPETVVSPKRLASASKQREKERQREHKRRQKKAARQSRATASALAC
ncbi:MAG TPA: hypothetical protein VFB12_10530 [Ktedonobacteraceae bacterium]|nr:hypothetical protein [Ktedonobacteraceae bacterium]